MRFSLGLIAIGFFFSCNSTRAQSEDFKIVTQQFVQAYETMDLPRFGLDYVENLSNIQDKAAILEQEKTFLELEVALKKINTSDLSDSDKLDFDLIKYEIALNKFRISLEKQWNEEKPDSIPTSGLANVPAGKRWYTYFLKKWVDVKVTPETMYDFGLTEIQRVKGKMKSIQKNAGMDSFQFQAHLQQPEFFYNDPQEILTAYMIALIASDRLVGYIPTKEFPAITIKSNMPKRFRYLIYKNSFALLVIEKVGQPISKRLVMK